MGDSYGTAPPSLTREPPRATRGRFIALVAAFAVASVVAAVSLAKAHGGGPSALLSTVSLSRGGAGSLVKDSADLRGLADEVNADQHVNSALSKGLDHAAKKHCSCDCSLALPEMKAQAARATMLEQVGEDTFLGPCSSCPCAKSNDISAMVASLADRLVKEEAEMKLIGKSVDPEVPVDIMIRVGSKGKDGTTGPQGFKGVDGDGGIVGPPGPKGKVGDRGKKGDTGPIGFKGVDGSEGGVGAQGPQGDDGPPGNPGGEGAEGPTGKVGYDGANGLNGGTGLGGIWGDPGKHGKVGPRGPMGIQGPPGPKGAKGTDGGTGDRGGIGPGGSDGVKGDDGSAGGRGPYGKGCDGATPQDGSKPKVIDACGVCGGDESECAITSVSKTAHAVGDPHYLTFDGKSFDYQLQGEFILARHMNDIELQNLQVICPNPSVRCNRDAAVVTKNFNLRFKSQWLGGRISINGRELVVDKDYNYGVWNWLDSTTAYLMTSEHFEVYFNDNPLGDCAVATGYWSHWGPPLPNGYYMHLYFRAPGRWSSGLSMTGLFANFDNNAEDDWDAIAPSTMWWVKDTASSAFSNDKYLLHWTNRIVKSKEQQKNTQGSANIAINSDTVGHKAVGGTAMLGAQEWDATAWTDEMEKAALKEVDPLTAKMRRKLFAKMAAEGVVERKVGEAAPKTELAHAELDIMPYVGERPSPMRIEQQMLFRKEWKVLDEKQRHMMLAGGVVSNTATGFKHMCMSCVEGTEECAEKKIVKTPKADGITWPTEARKTACEEACFGWLKLPDSPSICSCWIDCSLGVKLELATSNLLTNYMKQRRVLLTPDDGEASEKCLNLDSSPAKVFRGDKPGARMRWTQEFAPNFAITFWWKPDMDATSGTYFKPDRKVILYKGLNQTDSGEYGMPSTKMVYIEIDASTPTKQVVVTVAGVEARVPADKCQSIGEDVFTFFAVTKRDTQVTVWCGKSGAAEAAKVHSFQLDGAEYKTTIDDVIAVGGIKAPEDQYAKGWMGKLNYIGVNYWDKTDKVKLWDVQIPARFTVGEPDACPS